MLEHAGYPVDLSERRGAGEQNAARGSWEATQRVGVAAVASAAWR